MTDITLEATVIDAFRETHQLQTSVRLTNYYFQCNDKTVVESPSGEIIIFHSRLGRGVSAAEISD